MVYLGKRLAFIFSIFKEREIKKDSLVSLLVKIIGPIASRQNMVIKDVAPLSDPLLKTNVSSELSPLNSLGPFGMAVIILIS